MITGIYFIHKKLFKYSILVSLLCFVLFFNILVVNYLLISILKINTGPLAIRLITNTGLNLGIIKSPPSVSAVIRSSVKIPISTPSPTPTPVFVKPTLIPASNSYNDWGKTVKLDDKTSASRFAPDDHMSTVDELNQAMNLYRQTHGLPTVNFDPLLCSIAQTRANQLQALGKLDSHAGFSDLAHNQKTYDTMDEILFGGVQPVADVHIVEWGWDQSLTGHHESISDPMWHNGCAGIAGYFAVFEFGAK